MVQTSQKTISCCRRFAGVAPALKCRKMLLSSKKIFPKETKSEILKNHFLWFWIFLFFVILFRSRLLSFNCLKSRFVSRNQCDQVGQILPLCFFNFWQNFETIFGKRFIFLGEFQILWMAKRKKTYLPTGHTDRNKRFDVVTVQACRFLSLYQENTNLRGRIIERLTSSIFCLDSAASTMLN